MLDWQGCAESGRHGTHGTTLLQMAALAPDAPTDGRRCMATDVSGLVIEAFAVLRRCAPSAEPVIESTHAPPAALLPTCNGPCER